MSSLKQLAQALRVITADTRAVSGQLVGRARAIGSIAGSVQHLGSQASHDPAFRAVLVTLDAASKSVHQAAHDLASAAEAGERYAASLVGAQGPLAGGGPDREGRGAQALPRDGAEAWASGRLASATSGLPDSWESRREVSPTARIEQFALVRAYLSGRDPAKGFTPPEAFVSLLNPGFSEDASVGRLMNCGECVRAFALTMEGQPNVAAEIYGVTIHEMEAWAGCSMTTSSQQGVERDLNELPEGSYAIVGILRAAAAGHWFIAYKSEDGVKYVEPQAGGHVTVTGWPPALASEATDWFCAVRRHNGGGSWSWN